MCKHMCNNIIYVSRDQLSANIRTIKLITIHLLGAYLYPLARAIRSIGFRIKTRDRSAYCIIIISFDVISYTYAVYIYNSLNDNFQNPM